MVAAGSPRGRVDTASSRAPFPDTVGDDAQVAGNALDEVGASIGFDAPNETPPALYEAPQKPTPISIVRIDSRGVDLTLPLNSCVSKGDVIGYREAVSQSDEELERAPVTAPADGKLVLLDAAGNGFGLVSGGAHACD